MAGPAARDTLHLGHATARRPLHRGDPRRHPLGALL